MLPIINICFPSQNIHIYISHMRQIISAFERSACVQSEENSHHSKNITFNIY